MVLALKAKGKKIMFHINVDSTRNISIAEMKQNQPKAAAIVRTGRNSFDLFDTKEEYEEYKRSKKGYYIGNILRVRCEIRFSRGNPLPTGTRVRIIGIFGNGLYKCKRMGGSSTVYAILDNEMERIED